MNEFMGALFYPIRKSEFYILMIWPLMQGLKIMASMFWVG